jgi:uncharacterized repeat protein (TIGR03803 family)
MDPRRLAIRLVWSTLLFAFLFAGLKPAVAQTATETVLHSFGDGSVANDGQVPDAGLIQASDGNFYGTTYHGGSVGGGTVFKITPSGAVTILHSFFDGSVANDGGDPVAGLIQASDGNLYGTTSEGGSADNGTVFKITPSGTVTIIHSFLDGSVANDGAGPDAGLIQASDGNFYGTTEYGGSAGWGTVFKIAPSGAVTILHSFGDGSVANDGWYPCGGLIQASDGNFYGTTWYGGSADWGTVFKITPSGTVTILHSFGDGSVANDGWYPFAGLIQASDGNFYGATWYGGSTAVAGEDYGNGWGTVFKITPSGTVTILHSFGDGSVANDGCEPFAGLIQASDGNFYGTTAGGGSAENGTVFKITPSGAVTILHSFGDGSVANDGWRPEAVLIQASDGNFYGATVWGGSTGINDGWGYGTVFRITMNSAGTQTYTQTAQFLASDESLWGEGAAKSLSRTWNSPKIGPLNSSKNLPMELSIPKLGKTGIDASYDVSDVTAGLVFKAWLNSGSVSVQYPVDLNLTYPSDGTWTWQSGQTFALSSAWGADSAASLNSTSPSAGAEVSAVLSGQVGLGVTTVVPGHNPTSLVRIPSGYPSSLESIDYDQPLVSTKGWDSGSWSLFGGSLSGTYELTPNLNASGSLNGTTLSSAATDNNMFTVTGDISDIIADTLGIPIGQISADCSSPTIGIGKLNLSMDFDMDADLLDLGITGAIGLGQQLSFTASPETTLDFSAPVSVYNESNQLLAQGTSCTFHLGETVNIAPDQNETIVVTPSVSLADNDFTNITDVTYGSSIEMDWFDLDASATIDVELGKAKGSYTVGPYEFQPIKPWSKELAQGSIKPALFDKTFPLTGFADQTLPSFDIVPVGCSYVQSVSASDATAADGGHSITVSGSGFVDGCSVCWNGSPLPTTYVNSKTLLASIPETDLGNTGSATIAVLSPGPAAGRSNEMTFAVK